MGFFSWNCKACGHPLLSAYATNDINEWMMDGVAITEDGSVLKGEYDGYGRLDDREFDGEPECYHEACWKLIGKPTEFTGSSESARDQGYFFDDPVHSFPEPKSTEDLQTIKIAGDLAQKNCCNEWKMSHLEYMLEKAADAFEKLIDLGIVDVKNDDIREEIEALGGLIEHRDDKERKRVEGIAERNNIEVEEFIELESVYKDIRDTQIFSSQPIKKVEEGMFRIFRDEYSYEEINISDGTVSDIKYLEDEMSTV